MVKDETPDYDNGLSLWTIDGDSEDYRASGSTYTWTTTLTANPTARAWVYKWERSERDVTFVGADDRIELWSKRTTGFLEPETYAKLAEGVLGLT